MFEFLFLCTVVGGGVYVLKKRKTTLRREIKKWLEDEEKEG